MRRVASPCTEYLGRDWIYRNAMRSMWIAPYATGHPSSFDQQSQNQSFKEAGLNRYWGVKSAELR